ncbi:MAG: Crp/Fnr family transcriptional regulator [Methylococcaceae bacterium]|nr:Crp/Fnr family transcriptional regulator [Methylococcaceae bacterium]MCI0667736.1 Crp/Fnr family transcriptional regulator [Methylococcaceae bacterium]MCI0732625.1 Crp/Fnr family transcriptional regulator [Methylococcaceae bacterium]
MDTAVYEVLGKIPIFSQLPDDARRSLASHATVKTYPKNAIVINEGDDTASFHFILSGTVRVYVSDEHGKELTLSVDGRGKYFGELALLDDAPRSASVITCEKAVCGVISKAEFKAWLNNNPNAPFGIIKGLVSKVRILTDKVRTLALSDVYGRLIIEIQNMAEDAGETKIIHNRPTQQDLANMIGASREMVSKIFKELIKGKYITLDGKKLIINKKLPSSW